MNLSASQPTSLHVQMFTGSCKYERMRSYGRSLPRRETKTPAVEARTCIHEHSLIDACICICLFTQIQVNVAHKCLIESQSIPKLELPQAIELLLRLRKRQEVNLKTT